jgi:copper chaperone CopZ
MTPILHTGLRFTLGACLALGSAFAHAQGAPAASPAATASASEQTLKIQVNGMVCAFCAQGIEKRLKALPAVGSLYIDLENKLVAVAPKPGQRLDTERVKKEIVQAGYDVHKVEPSVKTVAELRSELRSKK